MPGNFKSVPGNFKSVPGNFKSYDFSGSNKFGPDDFSWADII